MSEFTRNHLPESHNSTRFSLSARQFIRLRYLDKSATNWFAKIAIMHGLARDPVQVLVIAQIVAQDS